MSSCTLIILFVGPGFHPRLQLYIVKQCPHRTAVGDLHKPRDDEGIILLHKLCVYILYALDKAARYFYG